jgi:hypothetical protein
MRFNTDGFNERNNYIHNSNDMNRLNRMGTSNIDNSFAKMKVEENKPDVQTANTDAVIFKEEVRGAKENFVLRNHNMLNANVKPSHNNPVKNAMDRNLFKKI